MSDPAPPPPPPRAPLSDAEIASGLKALRQNFKVAAIAHWAVLFGHHVGFEFDTEVSAPSSSSAFPVGPGPLCALSRMAHLLAPESSALGHCLSKY